MNQAENNLHIDWCYDHTLCCDEDHMCLCRRKNKLLSPSLKTNLILTCQVNLPALSTENLIKVESHLYYQAAGLFMVKMAHDRYLASGPEKRN